MPIPIKPNGNGNGSERIKSANNFLIDYSLLLSGFPSIEATQKKIVTASDKDADILMELWINAEKTKNGSLKISKDVKITSSEISKLKNKGLLNGISGGSDEFEVTAKGRAVITTMVLGENNRFLKNQKNKSYTEIMASMSKKGKNGYRIPKIAYNYNLIRLPKDQEDQEDKENKEDIK